MYLFVKPSKRLTNAAMYMSAFHVLHEELATLQMPVLVQHLEHRQTPSWQIAWMWPKSQSFSNMLLSYVRLIWYTHTQVAYWPGLSSHCVVTPIFNACHAFAELSVSSSIGRVARVAISAGCVKLLVHSSKPSLPQGSCLYRYRRCVPVYLPLLVKMLAHCSQVLL